MALVDRIEHALDGAIDPDRFEKAAVSLLRDRYPWLSPVEAGTDFGRDADIYQVVAGDPEARGRLLATTGDPLANIKRSHKSWQKQPDFRVDKLVIACSRNITATARKKIDQFCREGDLPLPEYYGRQWLVDALIKNSEWREYLTGIIGRIEALQALKPSQEDGVLVGRDDLVSAVRSALDTQSDLILSGLPGVGKTRLLAATCSGHHLVIREGSAHLADDLVATSPSVVIVDDAQLDMDLLARVIRLRMQEGLNFQIIALTWPDVAPDVRLALPGAVLLEVNQLSRSDMNTIVLAKGVTGVHAREIILKQSDGRPGWAIALCEALILGDSAQVVSGQLLLSNVERYLRTWTDSAATLDAVACMAAVGGVGQQDLERVSELVKKPPADIVQAFRRISTSGLLEFNNGVWHLQPALASTLVNYWFFGPQKSRSWQSLADSFSDRSKSLSLTALRCARQFKESEARRIAQECWDRLPACSGWDEDAWIIVKEYCQLDEGAAQSACRAARSVLSLQRAPVVTPWGSNWEPWNDSAQETLRTSARAWRNDEAVHGLLDLAMRDGAKKSNSGEDPIGIIRDLAKHIDPDHGPVFEIRSVLLGHCHSWLALDNADQRRWSTYCSAVAACLTPEAQGVWYDPAASMTLHIASGIDSVVNLHRMIELWRGVDEKLHTAGADSISASDTASLLTLFEDWLRVAGSKGPGVETISVEQVAAGHRGAFLIFESLRPFINRHPGMAIRARRALSLATLWSVDLPEGFQLPEVDSDLALFAGLREPVLGAEEWIEKRTRDHADLAARLLSLGERQGVLLFKQLSDLAVSIDQENAGWMVAAEMAKSAESASLWLSESLNAEVPPLVYQFLIVARVNDEDFDEDSVLRASEGNVLRQPIVRAVLHESEVDGFARRLIQSLRPEENHLVESLFVKSAADDVLFLLLQSDEPCIRATAALTFDLGTGHGPELPFEWKDLWRTAFLEADRETLPSHSQWRLGEALKALARTDPEVCADWYEMRVDDRPTGWFGGRLSEVEPILKFLPRAHRRRLAIQVAASKGYAALLLPYLVGGDAELARDMLEVGQIGPEDALNSLSGDRDDTVRLIAPLLISKGIAPETIAEYTLLNQSFDGSEAAAIRDDMTWFVSLAESQPELSSVSEAAMRILSDQLVGVEEAERIEEIRGRRP